MPEHVEAREHESGALRHTRFAEAETREQLELQHGPLPAHCAPATGRHVSPSQQGS